MTSSNQDMRDIHPVDDPIELKKAAASTDIRSHDDSIRPRKPVCPACGSDEVVADAVARWDVDGQKWQILFTTSRQRCYQCHAGNLQLRWVTHAKAPDPVAPARETSITHPDEGTQVRVTDVAQHQESGNE